MESLTKTRAYAKLIAYHILAWSIYIFFGLARKIFLTKYTFDLLDFIFTELPVVYLFYGQYFVLKKFLSTKRYAWLIAAEVILYFSAAGLYWLCGTIIRPFVPPGTIPPYIFSELLVDLMWIYLVYSFFSFGYYFAMESVTKEKRLRVMEQEKARIEADRLKSEYAFLRAQINPHFLHNTLNLFYTKSIMVSEELSEGILTLCEIMRYSMHTGEQDVDTVPLSREIEHVQNVIKINQLRFSNRLQVIFDIDGEMNDIRIIPLVIITLVENAFKHGELNNDRHPLVMQLKVSEEEGTIYFSTHNRKKTGPKELSNGIGMDNIKRRLEATYKNNYSLTTTEEADNYTVSLWITVS
ncbi:histidine kinase [Chitinophaga sp.]|uniref:sensor histidine kinase n=1 Tax=Chitinophaga sp. TaxID=1869181 RepID=UPI0031D618A8